MTTDASRVVVMLWDDHAGVTQNTTLQPRRLGTSFAINSRYTAAWYGLDSFTFDAIAGITKMRFTINGQLEDQGGIGFAMQDSVLFSQSSCLFAPNPLSARIDVAVCWSFIEQNVGTDKA